MPLKLPYFNIPVNIGGGIVKRNTSFNHCVILLITFMKMPRKMLIMCIAQILTTAAKRTEEHSITESVAYLWLLLYLAVTLHSCMLVLIQSS